MAEAFTPSMSNQRRMAAQQEASAARIEDRRRSELSQQKERADMAAAGSLQEMLQRDTNRLLRMFGTRGLSGNGRRASR